MTRAVLVPGVLALLPEYAGLEDPVADLRAACLEAVRWLGPDPTILADEQGARVGRSLLRAAGFETGLRPSSTTAGLLVVGNGSARRTEKAPGHLDERAHGFDDDLRAALASSDATWPDLTLGDSLWASLDGIGRLREIRPPGVTATIDYDDDPFGVQYWVMRWQW
ncbi:hypothetical protein ASC77_07420 [Nocardioides sp. Root1257]|uniref:hypothetical protein n=1 Tax=unclassified Nocardioides TaxID=2615069 RepID=UPI0006FE0493|nr:MULTISPECIES: hypothetical protein [unclassified Nocardioides]KQW48569.1 hypothetical protein ASC77_07420 [Nocardioides sp. Root1257]KRC47745.1 hypothetical protein ASE24_07425 [Nocardioides sp. Root224]